MDAAGEPVPCLYGLSEGGPTAILFAVSHPERTRALVLHGTMARTTYADDHPWLPTVETFIEAGAEAAHHRAGLRSRDRLQCAVHGRRSRRCRVLDGRLERTSITPGMLASVADASTTPTCGRCFRRCGCRHSWSIGWATGSSTYAAVAISPSTSKARWIVRLRRRSRTFFSASRDVPRRDRGISTGSRTAVGPERRLATVLFSDIVASTERAVGAGDTRWRDLLDRHHRAVWAELARFGGKEVRLWATGSSPRSTAQPPRTAALSGDSRR